MFLRPRPIICMLRPNGRRSEPAKPPQRCPIEIALHRTDTNELLGLIAYIVDGRSLAVEIVYVESADHSNTNLLRTEGRPKKYIGIAKPLFAYAMAASIKNGYHRVVVFKAKTSESVAYYIREFSTSHTGSYDPFRMVIWGDAAQLLIKDLERGD